MAIKVGDAFVQIGASTIGLDAALTGISAKVASMGASIAAAGTTMALGITAPLAIIAGFSLKTAADYSEAMASVKAVTNATEDEFKQLDKAAKDLGASTRYSAVQVAEAMKFMGMTGMDTVTILESIDEVLLLAASGNLEMGTAADIVTNIMAGFNMEASELGPTVDTLVKAFTSANVDLNMLGESMKYAGPVANAYGMSLEETAAIMGIFGNAGIQGSMAGTTLRQILIQLSQSADELGVNMYDASGNLLPMADLLSQLESKGLTATEIMDVFGARAGPGIAVLLEQGSGALKDFTTELENAGGTAQQVADTQMEGIHGEVIKLKSAFEGFRIALGEALIPVLVPLINKLTSLFRWFTNLNPTVKKIIVYFGVLAAAVGPVLIIIGKLMVLFAPLAGVISTLIGAAAAGGLAGLASTIAALLGPIGLVVLAIGGLVAALMVAYKKSETFRNGVQAVISAVKTAASYIKSAFVVIYNSIKTALDKVYEVFKKVWGFIGPYVKDALHVIKTAIGVFIDILQGDWSAAWEGIKEIVRTVFERIKDTIKNVIPSILKMIYDLGVDIANGIINGIGDLGGKIWGSIKGGLSSVKDKITGFFGISSPSKVMYKIGTQIGQGLVNGIEYMNPRIANSIDTMLPSGITSNILSTSNDIPGISGRSPQSVSVNITPTINVGRKLTQVEIDTMMNSWVSSADKTLKRKGIYCSG